MDWSAWLHPQVLLILIGAIFAGLVWGIQLNIAVLMHSKRHAHLEGRVDAHDKILDLLTKDLLRVSLILSGLEKSVEKAVGHVDEHEKEAEAWKHRIVAVEEKVKNHG